MAELVFDLALKRRELALAMKGSIPLDGVTAVVGPSGSGKTSLLMMLAGLEPGARGAVRFGDIAWASGRRGLRPEARGVGFVFQDGRLFRHLTVIENIAFGAKRRGVPPSAVQGVAEGLGLTGFLHRSAATLSGGETRRVALARALASGPDILFLDEPLSGLDDDAKAQVMPYMTRALAGAGIPAVYVSHSHDEVAQLADRVLRVDGGAITGWGRPPARLSVTVQATEGDHVTVDLDGARFVLRGHGIRGEPREIALPDTGLLLSRDPPGPSGALAVLPAEVVQILPRPSGPEVRLRLAGQQMDWRIPAGTALAGRVPEPGETLWLSLLSASLR